MRQPIASFAVTTALLAATGFVHAAEAATISIDYSFEGTADVVDGTATTLTLDALASGSITPNNPAQNAAWNPVTYSDESILDLNTGLLNGTFIVGFADGATLFGNLSEDDSAVLEDPSETGPFTQTLTFTGGTKEFAGATGQASGSGFVGITDFSVAGSGTLTVSGVPEPAPAILVFGGLAMVIAGRRFGKKLGIPAGADRV